MKLDIASPCRGICKIDEPTQLCTGCSRSIDEITRWREMDDDQKLAVLSACLNRIPERQHLPEKSEDPPSKENKSAGLSDGVSGGCE